MKKLQLFFVFIIVSLSALYIGRDGDTKTLPNSKQKIPKLFSQRKSFVKGKLEMDSPNMFAEYFKMIKSDMNSGKSNYPAGYKFSELKKAEKYLSLSKKQDLNWISRGPGNVGGRTRGIIIDPDDATAKTWFVAAVGGGVWKTTDAGLHWTELTSAEGSLSASYMAMAPSNHNIIYLGTGEGFGNLDALGGQGIWKTTDRGATWSLLTYTAKSGFGIVNRIIVDPSDANILVAVTTGEDGGTSKVWKSTDGGGNWVDKYSNNNEIHQIIYEPSNFLIQYATVYAVGVIKSTDGGETWAESTKGITAKGRVEIAISETNTSRLYASVDGAKADVYVTSDKAGNWTKCVSTENFLGGQGWYDNAIVVDPYDEDIFYVAGVDMYRVKYNGGDNVDVTKLIDNYGQDPSLHKGTHVDNHYFAVAKLNDATKKYRLVGSNDGGVCYTDDRGKTFKQPNVGFVTTQFYGVDKANGKDIYIGGMQDNSCYASPLNPSSSDNWKFVFGGDGFDVVWNYEDEKKVMLSSQYNQIAITHSGIDKLNQTGWYADVENGDELAPFITKLAQSKQYPDLVFTHGKNGIWRTDNFGDTWENIPMGAGYAGKYSVTEVKISLADPSIVWTGSSAVTSYPLRVSTDYGKTFTKLDAISNKVSSWLSGFATHPTEKETAYALFSTYRNAKIWKTTDLGKTWKDITNFGIVGSRNGFPDVAVFDLLVMPYDTNIIWVGTEIGIYESTDNGANWHPANNGLPPVSVYDMRIVNDEVVIGTHGRGVWSVSLPKLSGYEPPVVDLPVVIANKYLYQDRKQKVETELLFKGDYDKVEVFLNDVSIKEYLNVSKGDVENLTSEIVEGDNSVKVVATIGTKKIESLSSVFGLPLKDPSGSYVSDFNSMKSLSDDFYGDDYVLSQPTGFDNKAINTSHPYDLNKDHYLYLRNPIVVSGTYPNFSYKDVAIIEPGEDGTSYPDEGYWDYVTIEASSDGQNWKNLVTPYDADYKSDWRALYDNDGSPDKSTYEIHSFNTTAKFSKGDVILIRFKLYSDGGASSWGWIIDDLEIQKGALSLEDNYLSTQFKVFPNPVVDETLYLESTTESRISNIKLYNLSGQVLLNRDFADVNKAEVNVSSFAKGQYLIKVETGNGAFSKKVMIK
jgi:photosystem II stability/assembly factor-like uncharacterized protein